MEAEHLYHCLKHFFKANPKISWEKKDLLDAIEEQYMDLLNNQPVKVESNAAAAGVSAKTS
jgi:hypothetical protein